MVIKQKLNHQGNEVVTGETKTEEDVAVLGLYQVPGPSGGRIVLYGDSNCLDNAHMEKGSCLHSEKGYFVCELKQVTVTLCVYKNLNDCLSKR